MSPNQGFSFFRNKIISFIRKEVIFMITTYCIFLHKYTIFELDELGLFSLFGCSEEWFYTYL